MAVSVTRLDPNGEPRPTRPDLRRLGSYSVPFASAWRDRGAIVELERLLDRSTTWTAFDFLSARILHLVT